MPICGTPARHTLFLVRQLLPRDGAARPQESLERECTFEKQLEVAMSLISCWTSASVAQKPLEGPAND
jgi:hypothetical protein